MSYAKSKLDEAHRAAEEALDRREQAAHESAEKIEQSRREDRDLDRAQELQKSRESNQKDILIKKLDIIANQEDGTDAALKAADLALKGKQLDLDTTKEQNRASEKQRELDIKDKEAQNKAKSNETTK